MSVLDWCIVGACIAAVLWIGYAAGKKQKTQEDYYVGGRRIRPWLAGSSLAANQVSAISLIGAPAFIALREGGGLSWLQYELAVPLALIIIIMVLVPAYRRAGGFTIYAYIEKRFGRASRITLSLIFLASRSMGAGVILLATSYVASALVEVPLVPTILVIGAVALVYTTIGGIRADIYTDLLQLVILWGSSIACLFIILHLLDWDVAFGAADAARLAVFHARTTGLGDGDTFSLWPMLFGGLFLYLSYYGCDQSQAQRLLVTPDAPAAGRALVIAGLVRFPLVATYCAAGLLMLPFLARHPEFAEALRGKPADYLMPQFFIRYVPPVLLGFIIAGILAASMSSIDSAINSLSAVTWEDILRRAFPRVDALSARKKLAVSRFITVIWGVIATGFAVYLSGGRETVMELVNKIGSAFYGPVAGVFCMGLFIPRTRERSALAGLVTGTTVNLLLWRYCEASVSWMWWNAAGFAATICAGLIVSIGRSERAVFPTGKEDQPRAPGREGSRPASVLVLLAWFVFIVAACAAVQVLLGR